jgi:hypothetical protein
MSLNFKFSKGINFKTKMHKLPKKLVKRKHYFLVILFLFSSFYLGFFVSKVRAIDEFHSLRPYPADPWDKEVSETALFCGNNLIVTDTIAVAKNQATSCETLSNGNERCSFTVSSSKNIRIDLSDADFPILGNTENVVSADKNTDDSGFNDAEKMNEYVSWYLNGTINRAEYELLDSKDKEDVQKLVDFSGPLNKLLPWEQQVAYRINTINQADSTRHDQIVACTVAGVPVPCYHQGLLGIIDAKHKLTEWKEKIPLTLLSTWNERIPPQRENFENFLSYWKAYKEWRGDSCGKFTIPVLNKEVLLCFDNPLKPNYWANLFPYVPLSSTEDRVGLVETQSVTTSSPSGDVVLTEVSFNNQDPAELFFAHTEEVAELASILQKTFVPQGGEDNLSSSGVSTSKYCDLVNIRTNEGDDLFAGEIEGALSYKAEFTCDFGPAKNDCENAGGECISTPSCARVNKQTVNGGAGCDNVSEICCTRDAPISQEECKKEIHVNLSVITKTPKVDEIWARLVAGPSGVFKRIFPKVGPNTDLGCILDIPGATKVSYSGEGLVYAGNPGSERSGESAELYFPHIGGVYEYFLKGTQTLLRPKGFGENIIFGPPGDPLCIQNTSTIDICSDNCNSTPTNVDMAGVKEKFEELAKGWLDTGSPRIDKYEQVVNASLARGVDPIFTLAIWLHETAASNYLGICNEFGGGNPSSLYCQRIQDFGINRAKDETIINSSGEIIKDNFSNQLGQFVNLPGYYLSKCDLNTVECAWEIFGAMYTASGSCSPNDSSNKYVAGILEIYRWLSPTQQFPCYPIRLSN